MHGGNNYDENLLALRLKLPLGCAADDMMREREREIKALHTLALGKLGGGDGHLHREHQDQRTTKRDRHRTLVGKSFLR